MMTPNVFTLYLGDVKTLNLKALFASNLSPLNLTDCTEIDIALPNSDGTLTHRLLTLGQVVIESPAILGGFHTAISSLISSALNVGELQSFCVTFTIAGEVITVPYLQALSVFQRS